MRNNEKYTDRAKFRKNETHKNKLSLSYLRIKRYSCLSTDMRTGRGRTGKGAFRSRPTGLEPQWEP